ncbi:AAA family ATPase [Glutamicibacter sp. AOP38-B1-38]|uniref:AAA family ATPase n=2 Tax=Glutamicibacter TaxID=1742989 RepID=UPI0040347BEB
MDEELRGFMKSFAQLARLADQYQEHHKGQLLAPVLAEHLGLDPGTLSLVVENFASHRLADANIVLERLICVDPQARVIGLAGQERHHFDLSDLVGVQGNFGVLGEPSYTTLAVGPGRQQRFLSFGIHLFTTGQTPMVILLRQANPEYGKPEATLEVLCTDEKLVDSFLADFREGLHTTSIYRGQVISFKSSEYSESNAGITFHQREEISDEQLILPTGLRERIEEQVLGIGIHRDALLAHGSHLKRGVLLYGPPGTGKTHTVRYLASAAKDHTVILLNGNTLSLVSQASAMARALQPSIVVLEDCDLIAEDRSFGHGPQPLLFEVLDSMDGLDPDADVSFVLTTNRVESLERALVQRPGRIDLAVQIPRPDFDGRKALLRLYGSKLELSQETVDSVAQLTEGTTASFTREVIRRAILTASIAGVPVTERHVRISAADLMDDSATLTRNFLGGTEDPDLNGGEPDEESYGSFGWSPLPDTRDFGFVTDTESRSGSESPEAKED